MAEPIRALCDELIKAVNVMMEAESSQTYRLEALKFIEEFKEKSPFCVECGLQLAEKSQTAVVRHFGLQILEHVVKFKWNDMAPQEKLQLKNCTMGLLSGGTHPILQEECHVKDALSRIVVEMIKREWPQHWPDMLKEMEALTAMGYQRLLCFGLCFFFFFFSPGTFSYSALPNIICQIKLPFFSLQAKAHWRVGVATLNTLAGYIDWVALVYITNDNCHLLEILCLLLSEPELQLEAAECLLIAISRKGKLEERKPFMVLFDEVAMNYILSAAQSSGGIVERRYTFLKRLCQVLCALGSQICSLVGSDFEVQVPLNLDKYMEALFAFTTHPSQLLRSSTQMTWGNLFRHDILSKDTVVGQMAIKYLRAARISLVKTGFPSKNDCPGCEFSRVDFDSDEDFNCSFNSFRAQQGEAVRLACKIVPFEAFQIAREWVQYQICTPIDTGNTTSKTEKGLCSALSLTAVQWDAMTFFTESVLGQLFKILEKEKIPIDEGMELLQMVVNYETRDPLILSCVLTIISTLFPFVTHQPHFLPQVLFKIFPSITFELVEECKAPRTRAVKNLRRHACSSIIRICRDYSDFMLPCFDMMYEHVKKLFSSELLLTQMEKCALMEALILISNQFKDYNKQKAFLKELMAPVTAQWLSEEMKSVLLDPATFLAYVGADQVISDADTEDQMGINRSRISFCVNTILGVVKRARWPANPEEAKAGGFVVSTISDGAPIYRNPCAEPLQALLPNLFALIRTQNNLFLPENINRLSKTFTRVYEIMDVEKNFALGIPQPLLDAYDSSAYRNIAERMQGFFSSLYDNCYHMLGNAGPCMQQDFYAIEGLAEQIVGSAFTHLDSVPDHRLRPLQLVMSCPHDYYDSLLNPLLGPLFTYLLQVTLTSYTISGSMWLTNQTVTLQCFHMSHSPFHTGTVFLFIFYFIFCLGDEEMVSMESSQGIQMNTPSDELSELGKCLLQSEDIYMTLLTICFNSLSWKDTINCQRCASVLCWTLLKQVLGCNLLPDAVTWLYTSVLKGLQMHGQHEGCNAALTQLALLIYESLRPRYSELRFIMNQIPDIHVEALEQFDQKTIQSTVSKAGEKKKREQFKRLIAGTVGKPLGQQFKKEVHIRNLPSLFKKPKPTRDILENTDTPFEA
uniref:Importin N-terminal domain-containing protein n=1 Tax=Sinocyclocheilus anshuiensis TaxID=1608454 RepID=A0A671T661_9TELE